MFGKTNKPSPIDSLIGTGTTIEGEVRKEPSQKV